MKRTLFIVTVLVLAVISICGAGNITQEKKDRIISLQFFVKGTEWIGEDIETIDDYLGQSVRYPESARNKKQMGTEVVELVITTEGELTDFDVINSVSEAIDQEMIRDAAQLETGHLIVKMRELARYEELTEALKKVDTGEIGKKE